MSFFFIRAHSNAMTDAQDDVLFAKHEKLLEDEAYLGETLRRHRENAAEIINGSREAMIQHRITCDSLSHELRKTTRELEFTERLIGARFQSGKLNLVER